MNRTAFLILTGIGVGLIGCSTIDVSSESSPTATLSNYHTFAFAPRKNAGALLDQRIRPAFESNLGKIGITQARPGQTPDFFITYSARVKDKMGVTEADPDYWGGFGPYGFPEYTVPEPYEYKEGTLNISFIDPKTKSVIWRGVAEEAIDESKDHIKIRNAVEKLVANFNDTRRNQQKTQLAER